MPEEDKKEIEESEVSEDEEFEEEEISELEDKIEREEEQTIKDNFTDIENLSSEFEAPILNQSNDFQEPTNLETQLETSTFFNQEEKKDEKEYQVISQEYESLQREIIRHNPNLLMKQQSFLDLEKQNIVENFPKQEFNPFADKNLREQDNVDKNYIVKHSFEDIESKPHNPFGKQEYKYDSF